MHGSSSVLQSSTTLQRQVTERQCGLWHIKQYLVWFETVMSA